MPRAGAIVTTGLTQGVSPSLALPDRFLTITAGNIVCYRAARVSNRCFDVSFS